MNLLEMKHISKSFGEQKVLNDINLKIKKGKIHVLLGENGAGKSTLMSILFGMSSIWESGGFSGELLFEGKQVKIKNPFEAMHLGIGMVHQELMLVEDLTVYENIMLHEEFTKDTFISRFFGKSLSLIDKKKMKKEAEKSLLKMGISLNCDTKVSSLSLSYKQMIEIAREIRKEDKKLLILDEPTAILDLEESKKLLSIIKRLAKDGISVLLITHKLSEAIEIADEITVIRNGTTVATLDKKETNEKELAYLMIGKHSDKNRITQEKEGKKTVLLSLRNFYVQKKSEEVKGIDLDIFEGEILGIAGISGQGKLGIGNGILGIEKAYGTMKFCEKEIPLNETKAILQEGAAFVSEERKKNGLLLENSIEENICWSAAHIKNRFIKKVFFTDFADKKEMKKWSIQMIKDLDIRCKRYNQKVKELSGGNQQKVCLARALTLEPKLLIVSEVTRGIDIGAKEILIKKLLEENKKGMTILMIDSDLEQLIQLCDRIAVMYDGKIQTILSPSESIEKFGLFMGGAYREEVV